MDKNWSYIKAELCGIVLYYIILLYVHVINVEVSEFCDIMWLIWSFKN